MIAKELDENILGFSLVSLVVSITVATVLVMALGLLAGSLYQTQENESISYQGNQYSLAPSYGEFQKAISLHLNFQSACDKADSVYVYGGRRSHPLLDASGPSVVLSPTFQVTGPLNGDGSNCLNLQSSWESKTVYTDLDNSWISPGSVSDFTVLTMQGRSRITSITHQHAYHVTTDLRSVGCYEVTHQPIDWGTGLPVTGAIMAYRVYYRETEDNWQIVPGAEHFWYRTDPSWQRVQEAPARVTFIDPSALGGNASHAAVNAGSRFDYFLPVAR